MGESDLGVAILHFRNADGIDAVVRGLNAQTRQGWQLVIVDNHSADGSQDEIRRRHPSVPMLELPTNNGYGAGMNAGIRWLRKRCAKRILLVTQDCILGPRSVGNLELALQENRELGVVGPLLIRASTPGQVWSAGGELRPITRRGVHVASGTEAPQDCRDLQPCIWLDGASLMYRTEALDDAGPFREDFFLYGEDLEHHLRVSDAGWGVACVKDAMALQDTLGVPPYLAIRNHLLLCRTRGWRSEAATTLGQALIQSSVRAVQHWAPWLISATVLGALDARSGRLRRELARRR